MCTAMLCVHGRSTCQTRGLHKGEELRMEELSMPGTWNKMRYVSSALNIKLMKVSLETGPLFL